jgi:flagellar hook-length control protein FliK
MAAAQASAAATVAPADAAADPSQNGGTAAIAAANTAAGSGAAVAARLAHTAYQTTPPMQVNLPQMAYEIVRHVQQGANHFQIRLDPADLGRVDVNLAIDTSGTVNARLTVERADTLDLLRRDAGQLGQALSQAGLDGSKTNLQFSLSQNPFTRQDNGSANSRGSFNPPSGADDETAVSSVESTAAASIYRGTASAGGLNLFV